MPHFFISYAKADTRALALALAESLNLPPHVTAWVDKDRQVKASSWAGQIKEQIQRCDYMVVLLSKDVNRLGDQERGENFVLKEIEYMIQLKKERQILVVLAQDTPIPLILIGEQYLDFTHSTDAVTLADLICAELNLPRITDLRREQAAEQTQLAAEHAERDRRAREQAEQQGLGAEQRQVSPRYARAARINLVRMGAGIATMLAVGLFVLASLNNSANRALPTSTPRPIIYPQNVQTVVNAARNFTGSNADWQALYPDGFIHTFDDGIPMVLVPAGCLLMGSINGDTDEQPVHEQCFTEPFWIDLIEVRQADFARLGGLKATTNQIFAGADRPINTITWFEARAFCALRDARLPTEREWEYAARGPDALVYPWGNAWNADNAVWGGNSNNQTASVGSRPAGASWVGAFDLSGNIWEWVSTIYGVEQDFDFNFNEANELLYAYPYTESDGREVNSVNRTDIRVMRGGSWNSITDALRAAERSRDHPGFGYFNVGFRCARSR